MNYNTLTETCFFAAEHAGTLDREDPRCFWVRNGRPDRGDVLDIYLAVDAQGRVVKARFQACGDPYLLALSEWVCREMEVHGIANDSHFSYRTLITLFDIPHVRYPVALQVEDVVRELAERIREQFGEQLDG